MRSFTFSDEYAYMGDKAVIPVSLLMANGVSVDIEPVLDTGAEVSLLSRAIAQNLGIRIEDGEPLDLMVVSGHTATAYPHDVDLDFLGRRLTIRVAIIPEWKTGNFLGMRGFLDQMPVAINHPEHRIHF